MQKITQPPAFQRPSGYLSLGLQMNNPALDIEVAVNISDVPADFTDGIENGGLHRITPGIAGFYSIYGQVYWIDAFINNNWYQSLLKVSGNIISDNTLMCAANSLLAVPVFKNIWWLNATDFVELYSKHHGDNQTADIKDGVHKTFLCVQRVR
jgi:hypothetical protein